MKCSFKKRLLPLALYYAVLLLMVLFAFSALYLHYGHASHATMGALYALPMSADTPESVASAAPVNDGLEEYTVPSGESLRNLMFYFPGHAPSEELEYKPVPFESLLPKGDFAGEVQPAQEAEE